MQKRDLTPFIALKSTGRGKEFDRFSGHHIYTRQTGAMGAPRGSEILNNKKRYFATSAILGLTLLLGLPAAHAETPLERAWIVSSWDKLDDQTIEDAQPGIFIFASTNYSIMFANTAEARPEYDGDAGMTDDEKLPAYDSLTANSGGYEIDGNKFTTYAYAAKDTNYMAGFPENGVEYEFARDGDMLTITSLSFAVELKVVLERVEGKDGPWKTE